MDVKEGTQMITIVIGREEVLALFAGLTMYQYVKFWIKQRGVK